ncbi:hypothetical protein ABE545_19135 [Sphingobacterium faecium]|uniref:hypothetical protein n=2 Tax=Sphingobacterium TaxID=28453 RepID=UPI00040BAC66
MIFVLKRKWDAEAVRMYQQEQVEGLEKQLKEAKQESKKAAIEAKAEGQHQKAIETALNLKEMGLSTHQIAKATGLTIDLFQFFNQTDALFSGF